MAASKVGTGLLERSDTLGLVKDFGLRFKLKSAGFFISDSPGELLAARHLSRRVQSKSRLAHENGSRQAYSLATLAGGPSDTSAHLVPKR